LGEQGKLTARQTPALSPFGGTLEGPGPTEAELKIRGVFYLIPACPPSFSGLETEGTRAELSPCTCDGAAPPKIPKPRFIAAFASDA